MSELRKAVQAVVDQWDTPNWKLVMHTGVLIDRLRAAIEQYVAEAVSEEREECALIADEWATFEQRQFGKGGPAAAIRARAEKETK